MAFISAQLTVTRLFFSAILVAALASAFFASFPVWVVCLLAGAQWIFFLRPRLGIAASVALVTISGLWLVLAAEMLVQPIGASILSAFLVLLVMISAIPLFPLIGKGSTALTPQPFAGQSWASFIPTLAGSLAWVLTILVAQVLPGAARLAWITGGDSANNILMARDVLFNGGIRLGEGANPVPMSSGLLALIVAPAASGRGSELALAQDLIGLATLWSLLIIGSCFLIGLFAKVVLARLGLKGWFPGVVVAITSLIPLTWFYSGYPVEYGFLNAELALLVLFAGILIVYSTERLPALTFGVLFFVATLLLAVWSPLVLIPSALALVVFLRNRKEILTVRRWRMVALILAIVQFFVFVIVATLPSFLALGGALSAGGAIFTFPKLLLIGLGAAALIAPLIVSRTWKSLDFQGSFAVLAGCGAGLVFLLFTNRSLPQIWTYYPLKFLWLACVLALVFSTIYGFAIVGKYVKPMWGLGLGGLAILTAFSLILAWAPVRQPGYETRSPVVRVLKGNYLGTADDVVDRILASDKTGTLHFLWKTGDPFEGAINSWILQDRANTLMASGHEFRVYSYEIYDKDDVNSICTLARLNGGTLIVNTADATVKSQLAMFCPELDISVVR